MKYGILGGGQLGKMLIQEALNYNIEFGVLDPDANAPCKNICETFVNQDFKNYEQVLEFGKNFDCITIEIENVNTQALAVLEKQGKRIYPQPHIIELIKDKSLQKKFFQEKNIPTSSFFVVENKEELLQKNLSFPFVQKLCVGGYDGKGVNIIKDNNQIQNGFDNAMIIEEYIPFEKEISVIVARDFEGYTQAFPLVECQFNEANLVDTLFAPANVSTQTQNIATNIALQVISELQMIGILAVEMFVTKEGKVLVNEIAPRPHNSGHHTIEANAVSQYTQLIHILAHLPLAPCYALKPAAMYNIVSPPGKVGTAKYVGLQKIAQMPEVYIHLYGKNQCKPNRKMGHITVTDQSIEACLMKIEEVKKNLFVEVDEFF
jgi:5-(carboxyamino)imidazole ribonucleotide synthase